MSRSSKRFTKLVYVKWEGLDQEQPWRSVNDSVGDAAEQGETVYVAEYGLRRVLTVKLNPEVKVCKI